MVSTISFVSACNRVNSTTCTIHVNLFDVEKKNYKKKTIDKIKRDVKEIGIKSYPTIVLFNGNTKLIEQYDGERKLSKYKELLTNL